jgi:hypothetical protein
MSAVVSLGATGHTTCTSGGVSEQECACVYAYTGTKMGTFFLVLGTRDFL